MVTRNPAIVLAAARRPAACSGFHHRMTTPRLASLPALLVPLVLAACGGDDGGGTITPTDVAFGDTAVVLVLNPPINAENKDAGVAMPGTTRAGVRISSDDGIATTTDADGIAVLAPLTAGARTFTLSGGGLDSTFTLTLSDGALREVAVAAQTTSAQVMVDVDYKSDQVVEIAPTMAAADVNAALAGSDRVVFVRGGTYVGDLTLAGSRVTLFGEGALGGAVTIDGNVTLSGSDSRLRGAHVTGQLTVPASGTGVTFSRIDGALAVAGSDVTLLSNALCGAVDVGSGASGAIVVGNDSTAAACP